MGLLAQVFLGISVLRLFGRLEAGDQIVIDLELVQESHHLLLHSGQLNLELEAGGVQHVVLEVEDGGPGHHGGHQHQLLQQRRVQRHDQQRGAEPAETERAHRDSESA